MGTTKNVQLAKLALGIVGAASLAGITGHFAKSNTVSTDGALAATPSREEQDRTREDDAWWLLERDDHDKVKDKHHKDKHHQSATSAPERQSNEQLPPTRTGHS